MELPLSLSFRLLSVTSPDKPVERPFEANLTAGSMQQGSISKGQPNKTSKNETKRHEAMRCKRKTRSQQQLPTTTFVTWSILAAGLGPRLRLRLQLRLGLPIATVLGNICRGEKHVFGNGIDHV